MAESSQAEVSTAVRWNDPEYLRALINQTVARVEELATASSFQIREVLPPEAIDIAHAERQHTKRLQNNEAIRERYARIRKEKLKSMSVLERTAFEEVLG